MTVTKNIIIFPIRHPAPQCCSCCPEITGTECPYKSLAADLLDRLVQIPEDAD